MKNWAKLKLTGCCGQPLLVTVMYLSVLDAAGWSLCLLPCVVSAAKHHSPAPDWKRYLLLLLLALVVLGLASDLALSAGACIPAGQAILAFLIVYPFVLVFSAVLAVTASAALRDSHAEQLELCSRQGGDGGRGPGRGGHGGALSKTEVEGEETGGCTAITPYITVSNFAGAGAAALMMALPLRVALYYTVFGGFRNMSKGTEKERGKPL